MALPARAAIMQRLVSPALPILRPVCYNPSHGVLAHLVERGIRIAEVAGSSPAHSTITQTTSAPAPLHRHLDHFRPRHLPII